MKWRLNYKSTNDTFESTHGFLYTINVSCYKPMACSHRGWIKVWGTLMIWNTHRSPSLPSTRERWQVGLHHIKVNPYRQFSTRSAYMPPFQPFSAHPSMACCQGTSAAFQESCPVTGILLACWSSACLMSRATANAATIAVRIRSPVGTSPLR